MMRLIKVAPHWLSGTNLKVTVWFITIGLSLIPHMELWGVGITEMKRFARDKWWSKAPFLPVPGSSYWEFRMESIYGDPKATPSRKDLIEYLEWCLEIR